MHASSSSSPPAPLLFARLLLLLLLLFRCRALLLVARRVLLGQDRCLGRCGVVDVRQRLVSTATNVRTIIRCLYMTQLDNKNKPKMTSLVAVSCVSILSV